MRISFAALGIGMILEPTRLINGPEDVGRDAEAPRRGVRHEALQLTMQVYNALRELGLIYQVDPTSPFTQVQENTLLVDSISLPRDTLSRITGDCDDLTVLFCSLLETAGIETGFITVPGHIYLAVNTKEATRNYRNIHPNRDLSLNVDGELWIPVEITLAALRIARQEGVTTIFNPAPARPELPDELFQLSDIFCPNESETELLTGLTVSTIMEAETAARGLLERGAGMVILTLGERGSLLVNSDGSAHVAATPVKALDTTGAGDAFVGSLAYFLAIGKSLTEAMRRANQIAAISVQSSGTQTSFPVAADLPPDLLT